MRGFLFKQTIRQALAGCYSIAAKFGRRATLVLDSCQKLAQAQKI